jgi:hypothetical protein
MNNSQSRQKSAIDQSKQSKGILEQTVTSKGYKLTPLPPRIRLEEIEAPLLRRPLAFSCV